MDRRKIAGLAGVVTLVVLAARFLPGYVVDGWVDQGFPAWAPTLGTIGQTATVYLYVGNAIGPLVTAGLALALGVAVGRRIDVAREYRRFTGAVFGGSALAIAVPVLALTVGGGSVPTGAVDVVLTVGSLLSAIASVSVTVTVGALAGAALVHFRAQDDHARYRPTDAGLSSSGTESDTAPTDDPDAGTSPAR